MKWFYRFLDSVLEKIFLKKFGYNDLEEILNKFLGRVLEKRFLIDFGTVLFKKK